MWICFNDAFVSVVQSDHDPDTLMVRGRAYKHLRNLFPNAQIHITPENDYRYRVYIDKASFAMLVAERIVDLSYPNFKDSVKEDKLHALYGKFWYDHMIYQNGKKWWKKHLAKYYAEKEVKGVTEVKV